MKMIFKAALNKRTVCEKDLAVDDDNNKRRRPAHHVMISSVLNSWNFQHCGPNSHGQSFGNFSKFSGRTTSLRAICLFTTGLAFLLGILVGVMIPLYVLPHGSVGHSRLSAKTTSLRQNISRIPTSSGKNDTVDLNNVNTTIPRPTLENVSEPIGYSSVTFVLKRERKPEIIKSVTDTWKINSPNLLSHFGSDSSVMQGVYWGRRVEESMPKGFDDDVADVWRRFARRTPVVKVEEGCGRMQNRLLTFEDGTQTCCRYRQNTDQIQGELFSFYLGRLLGLKNLVPSALGLVRFRDPLWSRVRSQLSLAQWNDERTVVLTRFVPDLEPAHIPTSLRAANRRLHPPDAFRYSSSTEQLVDLAQWSDLIIFDYLTANLDRVVNNLYNLQWNPAMMDAPTHNLAREPASGLLIFFDNESGLLHGYRLLDKYEQYHGIMLEALCVFRKPTIDIIKSLHRDRNVGQLLQKRFEACDPEFRDFLPPLPDKSIKILNERIDRVYDQVMQCERQYPVNSS